MKSESEYVLQKITRFSKGMIHRSYPGIDMVQLSPGPLTGWFFSAQVGPYHVNAGSFDRGLLYEGLFNPGRMHVGFILSPQHSAIVHAHEYNSGVIDINVGSVFVHEVFPAGMVWVNIFADENTMMRRIKYSKDKLHKNPHMVIEGLRDELPPLIGLVENCIRQADSNRSGNRDCSPKQFESAFYNLLSVRFTEDLYEQLFITGDKFRMQMLKKTNNRSLLNNNQPLSLKEICSSINMKSRTVQKYFHEIYGMGPTEYFRIRRLNGARDDLINGAPSVSDVALKWGFTHFGRFAGIYKKLFGESPAVTIENCSYADSHL